MLELLIFYFLSYCLSLDCSESRARYKGSHTGNLPRTVIPETSVSGTGGGSGCEMGRRKNQQKHVTELVSAVGNCCSILLPDSQGILSNVSLNQLTQNWLSEMWLGLSTFSSETCKRTQGESDSQHWAQALLDRSHGNFEMRREEGAALFLRLYCESTAHSKLVPGEK